MLPSALLAVMAIDPTPAELRALATVQNVADWCGLQGTATDRATPLGSLFSLLGVTANMQPRVIGFMSAADYRAAVEQWRIGADAATATLPTFVQRSQGGLFGRTCRLIAGTEQTLAQQAANVAAASTATAVGAKRKINMASVI